MKQHNLNGGGNFRLFPLYFPLVRTHTDLDVVTNISWATRRALLRGNGTSDAPMSSFVNLFWCFFHRKKKNGKKKNLPTGCCHSDLFSPFFPFFCNAVFKSFNYNSPHWRCTIRWKPLYEIIPRGDSASTISDLLVKSHVFPLVELHIMFWDELLKILGL